MLDVYQVKTAGVLCAQLVVTISELSVVIVVVP